MASAVLLSRAQQVSVKTGSSLPLPSGFWVVRLALLPFHLSSASLSSLEAFESLMGPVSIPRLQTWHENLMARSRRVDHLNDQS